MKRFAVGYMDYFYNDLIVEIVEADNWFNALKKHSKLSEEAEEYFSEIYSDDIEEVKDEFFNSDQLFDVKEII